MAECRDCHSIEIFSVPRSGNGVCSHCYGSGRSTLSGLNEKLAGCPLDCDYCDGTGVCQTCGGTGTIDDDDHEEDCNSKTKTSTNSYSSYGNGGSGLRGTFYIQPVK